MERDSEQIVADLTQLLSETSQIDSFSLDRVRVAEVVTSLSAAIERFSPPGSPYRKRAKENLDSTKGVVNAFNAEILHGVLRSLVNAISAGSLVTYEELVHADVFADFVEMADHLLGKGYRNPAAVMVGSVLEEHLRKLCDRNQIKTTKTDGKHKKADSLNSELTAGSVYNKLDQKNVTAWLDLRNKAAHGKYGEFTAEQVGNMLSGIREFMARLPA